MRLGLRIDVDTFRGTRDGVPELCRILKQRGLHGTFFFTLGPDNMGRHLFRLFRPTFLRKMMRTKAGSLYGWSILFKGTLWPGPRIGRRLGSIIRSASEAGHEIGVHAWDHHRWQVGVERLGEQGLACETQLAFESLAEIIGREPTCSAAPGWRCTDEVLQVKGRFPFRYNSDCRGDCGAFLPIVEGQSLHQPQLPVTLPTWDEVAGRVADREYNDFLINTMRPGHDEVLAVHAEAEGLSKASLFEEFLDRVIATGREIVPLGALVNEDQQLPGRGMHQAEIEGREGWVAVVSPAP